MGSSDLDPTFVKALKLLLSRSKDSTEQLKQMADEVIEQRKKEIVNKISMGIVEDSSSSGFGAKSLVSKKEQQELTRKRERETEKANLEKLKQDIASLTEENPAKKARLEHGSSPVVSASPSPRSTDGKEKDRGTKPKTESKDKPRERLREIEEDIFFGLPSSSSSSNKQKDVDRSEKEERTKDKPKELSDPKEEKSSLSFDADSGSDTEVSSDELQKSGLEDMQFELELGNLSCVVCKAFGVSSINRLIECQECHSLYHQECHKPPVIDNVNDPRFVWYCNKCAKNLKKIVTKTTNKKGKAPLNARESPVGRTTAKPDSVPIQQPFKRLEQPIKSSTSKDNGGGSGASGNGSRGLSGLASLAANLSKSSSSLESSKTSKSEPGSRLSVLGPSSHSAFTSRIESSKISDASSKPMSSKTLEIPFKSSQLVKGEPSGKTSATTGNGGQSKVPSGKSVPLSNMASSSSMTKMSQSSLMSADKRLQMMKKQAAKMAEKRSTFK